MNTVDEILDYAIDQEQQAADFYASFAARAEKAGMKKMLLEFAQEENRHRERLLGVKTGESRLTPEEEILDLRISDYLVEVDASDNISYQDALIIAMRRERAAFKLYSDMAEKVTDANLKQVFLGLAKEEASHKLFFETEYEERVLMHN
ncbi:MAG: ferritin family protein [Deltaproteobacteria bacterium]|nr:ferritin family protein [Deltaproteobacteria bacterium]